MNKTLCSAAWTDININFGDRNIRHCCKSVEVLFPEELTVDFFNDSTRIKNTRSNLLNGIEAPDCIKCWKDYKNTGSAYRDFKNEWKSVQDISPVIKNIEVILDNLCDMSCVYCDECGSSRIAAEKNMSNRLRTAKEKDLDVFVEFLTALSKKQSYISMGFSGGEVTYSKHFFYFVERLLSTPELANFPIEFSFLTNGNTGETNMKKIISIIDRLPKAWHLNVSMSNELTGKSAELVRYGLSWERFLNNFKTYYKHPKVESLLLAPTLSLLSVKEFPNFIKTMSGVVDELGKTKKVTIYGNWITDPDFLNPVYSDKKYKKDIRELKQFVIKTKNFNTPHFIKFLETLEEKIGLKNIKDFELEHFLNTQVAQKKDTTLYNLKSLI